MNRFCTCALIPAVAFVLAGCGNTSDTEPSDDTQARELSTDSHTHSDGTTHDDHAHEAGEMHDHDHEEVALGTSMIGDMEVELAQGHGAVEPGKESHLVVKLPYSDDGETVIRAWIGTEDRTLSFVGKGEYAPSHDDYDIHATAPDPLPENAKWWIEIQKPDGTTVVGSVEPIMN